MTSKPQKKQAQEVSDSSDDDLLVATMGKKPNRSSNHYVGRPRPNSTTVASTSASSAPTPATMATSDTDYNTPATSNAVTPAPSIPARSAALAGGRRSLADTQPSQGSISKGQASSTMPSTRRTRRRLAPVNYVDDLEDEDQFDESSPHDIFLPGSRLLPSRGQTNQGTSTSHNKRAISLVSDDEEESSSASAPQKKRSKLTAAATTTNNNNNDNTVASGGSDNEEDNDTVITDTDSARSTIRTRAESVDIDNMDSDESLVWYRGRGPQIISGRSRLWKAKRRLKRNHPEFETMWTDLEDMPGLKTGKAEQPITISRQLKPFQLEGLAWMKAMEASRWKGGLLGDEMGLGKTIQAVSLIMSDYPARIPSLVLVPPVALMQWTNEIESYTGGLLKTLVFHGTNHKAKKMSIKELKKFDVIMMSYNTLESMYRRQEKGTKRKEGTYKEKSAIHQMRFHRAILDEAHCIKVGYSNPHGISF